MNSVEQISLGSPWWVDSDWVKKDRSITSVLKSGKYIAYRLFWLAEIRSAAT